MTRPGLLKQAQSQSSPMRVLICLLYGLCSRKAGSPASWGDRCCLQLVWREEGLSGVGSPWTRGRVAPCQEQKARGSDKDGHRKSEAWRRRWFGRPCRWWWLSGQAASRNRDVRWPRTAGRLSKALTAQPRVETWVCASEGRNYTQPRGLGGVLIQTAVRSFHRTRQAPRITPPRAHSNDEISAPKPRLPCLTREGRRRPLICSLHQHCQEGGREKGAWPSETPRFGSHPATY